jgi:methylenetetrahydrofolate reductase (NADPH)
MNASPAQRPSPSLPPPPARSFSFEFFPPKTAEGEAKLAQVVNQLGQLNPSFFSVTFGAGGSTQDGTLKTVQAIRAAGFNAAPHLSCIGSTAESIRDIVHRYKAAGIRHMVALRGDLPSGMAVAGEFRHADDLVRFVRAETGAHFHIEVAAYPEYHPQSRAAQDDLKNFKRKVDAGANSAITQYFYNPDAYFHFIDEVRAMGVDVPIVPGIMPIGSFSQLARFSDACGAEIPRWIRRKMEGFGDDTASIRAFGLDVVTGLCEELLEGGAPGLHFYTMNSAGLTSTVWQRLGL